MNTILTKRSVLFAAVLAWAGACNSLSFGPVSGATVIGRPLELSATLELDEPAQGGASGCVSAEVLYGDRRVDSARVHLSLSNDAARRATTVRISSPELVDEPFLTLLLHAGCGRQYTRRYVVLAEAQGEAPVAGGAASYLSFATAVAAPAAQGNPLPAAAAMGAGPARSAKNVAPRPSARVAERRRLAKTEAAAPQGGRLRLAVWDPAAEVSPWLRTSTALRSEPFSDPAHRAAATALWRALNADPQDLLRTAERLRGLEGEVSSLRALSARHRSEISSARESLQDAQSNGHIHLLLAVCLSLLAGGGAALFWHRSRTTRAAAPVASWYPPPDAHEDLEVEDDEELPAPSILPLPQKPGPVPIVLRAGVSRDAAPEPPKTAAPLEFTLPAVPAAPTMAAVTRVTRGLRVDALHGAQQQADFFASLGQVDEAVAVLADYIRECSEKPVLAFLELFRIYHAAGMRVQYEELQSQFRLAFGADTMSFGEFKEDEERGLDMYPVALGRVCASWPSAGGQEVIEELLFRRPSGPRELLSAQAYRELLWLYSLGQEIVHSTGMPAGLQLLGDTGVPIDHFILPWALGQEDVSQELSLDRLKAIDVAPGLNAFAVDIDLTAAPTDAAQQSWHSERKEPTPPVSPTAHRVTDSPDGFDAVMESMGRKGPR
jgi:hypothetical protein